MKVRRYITQAKSQIRKYFSSQGVIGMEWAAAGKD